MHPVRIKGERYVEPVVDEEQRAGLSQQRGQSCAGGHELRCGVTLIAQLNRPRAAGQRGLHDLYQGPGCG